MPPKWPSRACFACKAKKVKCDETNPSCQRCLRAGKICPGYRPEADLIFRNMNSISEKKVQTRVKARIGSGESPPTVSASNDQNSPAAGPDTNQEVILRPRETEPKISSPMSSNWKDLAVPRFFADYVFKSHVVCRGDLSFLPEICSRSNLHPSLKAALDAVAWLSLSNQFGFQWLKVEACKSYFHAVKLMATILQDPDKARGDATLATNYLFGLFEIISGFNISGTTWSRYRHHPGRVSLLRLRGKKQFTTAIGKSLFRMSYIHVTLKCLTEHIEPTEEAEAWLETFQPADPGLKLQRINLRTARLCYAAQELFDNISQDGSWMVKMLQVVKEAILVDLEYQQWNESLPAAWRYREVRRPDNGPYENNPEMRSSIISCHVYLDLHVAFVSNNYRAARIHLHEIVIRCAALIEAHPLADTFDTQQTRKHSTLIISEMISEICASTDFCLGDVNSSGDPAPTGYRMPLAGYLTIWPLWRAFVSAPEGSERKLWLRSKLEFISNSMGILSARTAINSPRMNPWDLRRISSDNRKCNSGC